MKQAMCEYRTFTLEFTSRKEIKQNVILFCSNSQPSTEHSFLGSYSWASPLALYDSLRAGSSVCCSDQWNPTVLSFCSVTRWSVTMHSHTNSCTCLPSPGPGPCTGSFDLATCCSYLSPWLPSSGAVSGFGRDEPSLLSHCLPVLKSVFPEMYPW